MNLTELERKLIATARAHPPGDHAPYAFEQRVRAHLGPRADQWVWWAHALWRAATPGLAVMLLLAAWTFGSGATNDTSHSVNADLESALLAAVDDPGES